MSPRQLERRKKELSDLIVEVLRRHPMLGYFQVCSLQLHPAHASLLWF